VRSQKRTPTPAVGRFLRRCAWHGRRRWSDALCYRFCGRSRACRCVWRHRRCGGTQRRRRRGSRGRRGSRHPHQFLVQRAVAGAALSVKDTQRKRQREKNSREPAGEFYQHVGGLSAENILSHAPTESGAKTLALRPLHQDDEGHQQCNQHVDGKENVDENVHFRGDQYVERRLACKPGALD